jgi:hypothetical protein
VLRPESGEDFVLTLQLGFALLDLAFLGVLDRLGLAVALDGGIAVLELLLLPAVDEGRGDVCFIAEIGEGCFSRRPRWRMATFPEPEKRRQGVFRGSLHSGNANPNGGFWQMQRRRNTSSGVRSRIDNTCTRAYS